MQTTSFDAKTISIVSSTIEVIAGIVLCFTPFAGVGAVMIGGIAGGYVAEALGISFTIGAFIGSIIGGYFGGQACKLVKHYLRQRRLQLLEERAIAARDAKVEELRRTLAHKELRDVATVVGGYNKSTGQVDFGVKCFDKLKYCAEAVVVEKLGGMKNIKNVVMTPAIRPYNYNVVPVCDYCQSIYSVSNFMIGITFK